MKMMAIVHVFVVIIGLTISIRVDPSLVSQCEKWFSGNQDKLTVLNNVAQNSQIHSCQQYCMISGAKFHTDKSSCQSLCEIVGYDKFKTILSLESESTMASTICGKMFDSEVPEVETSFVELSSTQSSQQRKLGLRGDLTVQGTVSASVITSPVGDVKVSGEMDVTNQIQASSARASTLKVAQSSIKQGIISKKDQLLIKGKIDADALSSVSLHTSFLEINNVKQWALHSFEDFEELNDVDGWSHGEITKCGAHTILGGHCVEKGNGQVSKTFTNLPSHTQIRINAKYMFIDSWDGETGYLKLDNNVVWSETYNHADGNLSHGINICGNETPERKFGRTIDLTIPHSSDSITLLFGATTDEHPCDESFGIDSVMVFVR